MTETNNETDHQETFTIDRESYDRLAKKTDFQRSINLLAMMVKIIEEITEDALKHRKIPKVEADRFRVEVRRDSLKRLLDNPPPGIDQDALKAFCE